MYRIRLSLFALAISLSASHSNATLPDFDCIIEPSDIVDAGSSIRGVLDSVNFDRSDVVKQGDVLAKLESAVEHAAVKRARINAKDKSAIELQTQAHQLLVHNQSRNLKLAKIAAISEQEMEQLTTEAEIAALRVKEEEKNFQLAQVEFERAAAALEKTVIRSPIEGVVMQRFKTRGEYIDDEPLLRIAKLHPLHVEVLLPTSHMGKIKPGMTANVSPAHHGSAELTALVERIDRVADAASDTFGVRLRLDNPDYEIPAGLRCSVAFNLESRDDDSATSESDYVNRQHANRDLQETEPDWVFGPIKSALAKLRAFSKPLTIEAEHKAPDSAELTEAKQKLASATVQRTSYGSQQP